MLISFAATKLHPPGPSPACDVAVDSRQAFAREELLQRLLALFFVNRESWRQSRILAAARRLCPDVFLNGRVQQAADRWIGCVGIELFRAKTEFRASIDTKPLRRFAFAARAPASNFLGNHRDTASCPAR